MPSTQVMEQLNKDFWWLLDFLGECHYFTAQNGIGGAFKKDLDSYHKMTYLNPEIQTFTTEYFKKPTGDCLKLHGILLRLKNHWNTALFGCDMKFKAEILARYERYMKAYTGFENTPGGD